MKFFFYMFLFLLLINCSFNKKSKFWTENTDKSEIIEKKIKEIIKKSDDLMTMTFEEFQIYIDDYAKKSEYPDLKK